MDQWLANVSGGDNETWAKRDDRLGASERCERRRTWYAATAKRFVSKQVLWSRFGGASRKISKSKPGGIRERPCSTQATTASVRSRAQATALALMQRRACAAQQAAAIGHDGSLDWPVAHQHQAPLCLLLHLCKSHPSLFAFLAHLHAPTLLQLGRRHALRLAASVQLPRVRAPDGLRETWSTSSFCTSLPALRSL